LADAVAVYLDGGPSGAAVPSTIVDITGAGARILRAGAISTEAIAEVTGGDSGEPATEPAP